mmetsp:Transcript_18702/g.36694  ORF Transcript_18702/g.36694 Transcript_18702/m.36694 type:complete len:104 (-) Transcript_18702:1389-1700(-)
MSTMADPGLLVLLDPPTAGIPASALLVPTRPANDVADETDSTPLVLANAKVPEAALGTAPTALPAAAEEHGPSLSLAADIAMLLAPSAEGQAAEPLSGWAPTG